MQAKTHKRSRGSKSGSPFHKKPKWHSWNGFRYDMHGNGMGVFLLDWRLPNFFRLTRQHGATLVAGYMERRGARKLLPCGWMVAE
jgi:hypothetical protein